jgi:hypothetical protein
MRTTLIFVTPAVLTLAVLAAPACSSSSSPGNAAGNDAGPAETGGGSSSGGDTGAGEAAAYPAPHPSPPAILSAAGGSVLATPTITPITFPSYAYATDVGAMVAALTQASYWTDTVKEYGVGGVTAGTPIVLTETAPTTIDDTAIQTWLAGKLTSDAGTFGAPSGSTVYTIFYPTGTSVTLQGATSCTGFGSYHSNTTVAGTDVAYAVIPQCSTTEDDVTASATAILVSALTDPFPETKPAFVEFDMDHAGWYSLANSEVGTICGSITVPATATLAGYAHAVDLAWSNAAAMAGHDPCVPSAAGTAYFNSAPVVKDTVAFTYGTTPIMTKGVHIAAGQSVTIDVDLFSDAPTSGAWTVSAKDSAQLGGTGQGALTFTWDKSSGQNGDVLHLTIAVAAQPKNAGQSFAVISTLGTTTHLWPVVVGN